MTSTGEQRPGSMRLRLGVGAVVLGAGAVWFTCRVVLDAFSAAGLAYVVGLGDGAGMLWPTGSAVAFWLLVIESCAACGVAGNAYMGRRSSSPLRAVVAGHVRFAIWVGRAAAATARAIGCRFHSNGRRAWRSPRVDLDDFYAIGLDTSAFGDVSIPQQAADSDAESTAK